MKKSVCLLILALLACSCEIPFSIDDISEPRFLIECVPTAGDGAFDVMVAYADPAYGERRVGQYPFRPGDVSITVNDNPVATASMTWEQSGNYYTSSISGKFAPGDRVTVSVSGDGIPEATGTTVIPDEPVIKSVDITKINDKEDDNGKRFTVKLAEPVKEGEYYGLEIIVYEESYMLEIMKTPPFYKLDTLKYEYGTTPGQLASMSDINNLDLDAFAQVRYKYGGLINSGGPYAEYRPMVLLGCRQWDGDSYSFYLNASFDFGDILDGMPSGDTDYPVVDPYPYVPEPEDPDPDEPEDPEETYTIPIGAKTWYRIELFRLSEELFNYCKAQYLMDYNILSNFGVTPPNFTYSNIRGGLGVVGGVSCTRTELYPDPDNKDPDIPGLLRP